MIPLGDDLPTLRPPVTTYAILGTMWAVFLLVQRAGFDPAQLAATVCNYGLVPGELTHLAPLGTAVPLGNGLACVVDNDPINVLTPLTSMFLHGGWMHIIGNSLFLWVFGNNVEDSMGHWRFLVFYLLCGLAAAATQVLVSPAEAVPMVGASGAISGVMGAYLVLYPQVRVRMLFIFIVIFKVFRIPAWIVLLWWFALQVMEGVPELGRAGPQVGSGVAVWAHVGGFVTGLALIRLFQDAGMVAAHRRALGYLYGGAGSA
jgi:membrane associated rhomboid family serine protease